MKFRLILVALSAAPLVQAQEDKTTWFFRIGPSFGQPIIGSEDTRRGTHYGVGFRKPEPRFTFRGLKGEMMVEAYYLFTKGGGFEDIPVNNMRSFGAMMTARYHTGWLKNNDAYFDLGFGAVYNSFTTRDLDSRFNTTPTVGIGIQVKDYDFTIRWYHASNAGTTGNNQGTNQIQYLLGYRF